MNLFFDIEVYPYNAFVVFKNENKETLAIFKDDNRFTGLSEFISGHTLIGYNNYWYDDHILSAMLNGWSASQLKELNDRIISGERQRSKPKFRSLDVFQQIDVGSPSLKKIEGNMGKMILESSVPFDVDHPLTDEEYEEVIRYCSYDVDMTIDIYKMRINSYFLPKQSLVEMVGRGETWNTTTLSANALLSGKTLPKWADFRLSRDIHDLSLLEIVPTEVVELWRSGNEKGKVTIEEFGCVIEFGFGGLHGTHKTQTRAKNLKLLDVASMYPNIILHINALGTATEKYQYILEERLKAKAEGDTVKADALKLILNSVYGNLKNQYSTLFNPMAALSVCIYGQIALYTLCKRLSRVATIININTDGVGFIPHAEYESIWHEWEKEFHLTLEEDHFDTFIQKDVNNYIGVKGDKIKCKGADVGRYNGDSYFKNNSARIVDIAIVDNLLHGKSVIDTLIEHLDKPILYQYILQAGRTYLGTFDANGNQYNKINRIFPTKKGSVCLYKKRVDGGLVRFPDLPESMYVWNDDVDKLENFERIIDLNHYVTVINKKLERWS